jgi:hypothetical protein
MPRPLPCGRGNMDAMSSQNPMGGRGRPIPTLPQGDLVAAYDTYPEAQAAVDVLARANFPVAQVSIVGSDLKSVERVTGKLTWGRVAAAGAASGVWLGIFFGLLLEMFSSAGFGILIAAVLFGAGFGMLFGLVSYAITRRTRDYTSMTQVLASRYAIVVEPELAGRARTLLTEDVGLQNGVQQSGGYPGQHHGGGGRVQDATNYAPPTHPSEPSAAPVPPVTSYGQFPPPDPQSARPRYGENPPAADPAATRRVGVPAPKYGEYAPEAVPPAAADGASAHDDPAAGGDAARKDH